MLAHNVLFRVTCTTEDPQAPARVMGVFAARSLLPYRFLSSVVGDQVEMEIHIGLKEGEGTGPRHLARVIERFPLIASVSLSIDGALTAFGLECE